MLNGVTKEKLKMMHDACKTLGQMGLDEDVRLYHNRECLSMTRWSWGEIHMQVSPMTDYKPDRNDKLVREGKTILGLFWKNVKFKNGRFAYVCEIKEEDFLKVINNE